MPRLNWSAVGERFYEAGADRGVLYVGTQAGVPWNGLISVSESPTGGEPEPFYIDGFKYANVAAAEEFEATIQAFSSPREFGVCDGTVSIHNGLFVTQQPRKSFGLSYRTRIGNDVDGLDHGYKIHLIYNALSSPSERSNNTIGDSTEPMTLSWGVSTKPPRLSGYRPTSHFIIDSRMVPSKLLAHIESILYGSESSMPRMVEPQELLDLFTGVSAPIRRLNLVPNPRLIAGSTFWSSLSGVVPIVTVNDQKWARVVFDEYVYAMATAELGQYYAASIRVGGPVGTSFYVYGNDASLVAPEISIIPESGEIVIEAISGLPSAVSDLHFGVANYTNDDIYTTEAFIEKVEGPGLGVKGPFFDGSTPDVNGRIYGWTSTPDGSTSFEMGWD